MQQAFIGLFIALFTTPQALAQTCGALMLQSRASSQSAVEQLASEARHVVLTEYAQLLERMSVSRHRVLTLRRALNGQPESLELPDDLVERLLALPTEQKEQLAEILKIRNPSQSAFAHFLEQAFAGEVYTGDSCRRILSSYARFYQLSQDVEAIRKPEGGLELKTLLITGRLATAAEVQAGRSLVKSVRLKLDRVAEIRYVIYRDHRGHSRMRLSLLPKNEEDLTWGNRSPVYIGFGEELLAAGRLDLSRRGVVRAADLHGSTPLQRQLTAAELTDLFKAEFQLKTRHLSFYLEEEEWKKEFDPSRLFIGL